MTIWQILFWPFFLVPWQVWVGIAAVVCAGLAILLFVVTVSIVFNEYNKWPDKPWGILTGYGTIMFIFAAVALAKTIGLK